MWLRLILASPVMPAPPAGTVTARPAPTSTTAQETRAERRRQALAAIRAPTRTTVPAALATHSMGQHARTQPASAPALHILSLLWIISLLRRSFHIAVERCDRTLVSMQMVNLWHRMDWRRVTPSASRKATGMMVWMTRPWGGRGEGRMPPPRGVSEGGLATLLYARCEMVLADLDG